LLLPRVANTASVLSSINGMIIYDISQNCVRAYENGSWSNCFAGFTFPSISALDCNGSINNGTLTDGVAASSVSSIISYTGGNGSTHTGQIVTSTGVAGLTATLTAGNFATGAGTLTYNITGTPSGVGTASFAINIGGKTCSLTRTVVAPITIPATITLAQDRVYMIASVYDQDYLPYTAPSGPATINTQAANGSNEATTVNVQGSITTTGVNVKIPVTATGSNTLPAYSTTITIPSSMTEDGISRDLTLTWAAQAYTSGTTAINATIAAVGGTLNAKKLDINAGIGNDALGVLIGQLTYPYNNAGNTTTYSVRVIAGIPDLNFGNGTHNFLYLPVQNPTTGATWLNNNLGANYSNVNHASFNLAQQASSSTDFNAYGSLIQWGRKTDGHELINRTGVSSSSGVNGTTTTLSDNPANNLFIRNSNGTLDWRSSQNSTLWDGTNAVNNPCPVGYRLPTESEFNAEVLSWSSNNLAGAFASNLKLSTVGYRSNHDGIVYESGSNGIYWTSTPNFTFSRYLELRQFGNGAIVAFDSKERSRGAAVRCIRD